MRRIKTTLIAAGVLGLTAAPAAAAVVTNDLNLRSGPGTNYGVITAMPAGARVDTGNCRGNWCRVNWRGYSGWASASYLRGEGRTYRRAPAPTFRFGYYDRYDRWDRYRYRRGPGISFRLGL